MFSDLKTALLSPLALTAAVTGALAGEPMDGAAFDDYTRGKTLFYAQNGEAYGAEIYLDLIARFENLPGATQLYEATDVNAEMICLGPNVGV